MASGITEGEIRERLADGGHLRGVFVVSTGVGPTAEHLPYLFASWRVGYAVLRTFNDRADRPYRDLDRLLVLLRVEFRWSRAIPVYLVGDPDLSRFNHFSSRSPRTLVQVDGDGGIPVGGVSPER